MIHLQHIEMWKEGSEERGVFVPRIPGTRAPGENDAIPRICTSTSVEKCALAHPRIGYVLLEMTNDPNLADRVLEDMNCFLELNTFGILVRVYHFEVEEGLVETPETIAKNEWVPDVGKTDEHWIIEPITPSRVSYAILNEKVIGFDRERMQAISSIEVTKEVNTLDELGVFMNGAPLECYISENRLKHEKERNKKMTKTEAISFKKKVETFSFETKIEPTPFPF